MKRAIFFSMLIIGLFSCNNQTKQVKGVLEEDIVTELPNPSDTYFSDAIVAFSAENYAEAADQLEAGINAIKKEGIPLSGQEKAKLDHSIKNLETLLDNLRSEEPIEASWLRESIANAELSIAHDYLISSDAYVLEEPEAVNVRNVNKTFKRQLNAIKSELNTSSGKVKEEGEQLVATAQELELEMKSLNQRIKDHSDKMKTYLDEHHPKTRIPDYRYMAGF